MPAPGVLFDVDGTLIDTTYLHAVCWAEALAQQSIEVPAARLHRAIGRGGEELLDHVLGDGDRSHDEEAHAAHTALFAQWFGHLRRLPGAQEVLAACRARGLRTVLASSAQAAELRALTDALDADGGYDAATSSSDAEAGKPAPDILDAALRAGDVDRDRAVFVGDAVPDVEAARAAGIPCIAVTTGGTSAAELRDAGAVEVWDDVGVLAAHLDESVIATLH